MDDGFCTDAGGDCLYGQATAMLKNENEFKAEFAFKRVAVMDHFLLNQ